MQARSYIEGPRWAGLSTFLRNEAYRLNLELTLDIEKGWIRETVRFEVNGPTEKIKLFFKQIEVALNDLNKEDQ